MFYLPNLQHCKPGTAKHVAVHGLTRIQHDMRPSLPYDAIQDPELAFRTAAIGWILSEVVRGYDPDSMTLKGAFLYEFTYAGGHDEVYLQINELAEVFFDIKRPFQGNVPALVLDEDTSLFVADFGVEQVAVDSITLQAVCEGITVQIDHRTSPSLSTKRWRQMKYNLVTGDTVGPRPQELTAEERHQIEEFEAAQARIKEQELEEAAQILREAQQKFECKLGVLPPLDLATTQPWDLINKITAKKHRDVLKFAEGWARLIQEALVNGQTLQDCIEPAASEASLAYPGGRVHRTLAIDILRAATWRYADQLPHNESRATPETPVS